ncbi:hypothetical protein NBO_438g0003 [Nosema bombycis CQ1]|uniref:Uncharacterized protein n=1 Tax=Nosema bombycis (strain CQ1 / CVCC 102059) TaxID=578461 RepID=R0KQH7_NOSB1|nr:hypothetical protein NBO_438g0003 [Nosema bombycis CQ1]|eukprot:EOB12457.1 hypothetical protein NBO_438g0003 [Nosema bombycis CQ1]
MISIIKNHDLIFNNLIPKILIDFRELKTLYYKINEKNQKIKQRPQSFYTALFKKIDEKVKERQNHYLTFEDFIGGIIKNGMAAMSILQKAHGRYQMMKINFSSDELKNIDEKDLRLISEIDYKGTELLGIMSDIQLKLDEDLKQASSIYMIVDKFFEMSPKDFKANKEIADALKSLN